MWSIFEHRLSEVYLLEQNQRKCDVATILSPKGRVSVLTHFGETLIPSQSSGQISTYYGTPILWLCSVFRICHLAFGAP